MSLFDLYKNHIVAEHCPTIRELARSVDFPVSDVVLAIERLWEANKLCSIINAESGVPMIEDSDDLAPEDIPVICEYLARLWPIRAQGSLK